MEYRFAPAIGIKHLTFLYDPLVTIASVGASLQKMTLSHARITNGQSIIDIGCGTGTFAILAKKLFPDSPVLGIDPDESILAIARKKSEKLGVPIVFLAEGAEKLSIKNHSIDFVFSTLAFHHLPLTIKRQALKEVYRILSQHGKFFLTDIGKPKNLFWKIILDIESIIEPREYLKDNLRDKLPGLLKDAGFRVNEWRKPYMGIRFYSGEK